MKTRFTITLFMLLVIQTYSGWGQSFDEFLNVYKTTMPGVVNPSPTSMALKSYLGYPVSHATGLIDISIPLYEMNIGPLTIPFQLKYHSAGIRIQDPPGIVGFGWTLFPGCKISRTIKGKDDLRFPVVKEKISKDFKGGNIGYGTEEEKMKKMIAYASLPITSGDIDDTGTYVELGIDRMDSEYDIFTLSLPNNNVSFILQKETMSSDFNVVMIPEKQPFVITPLLDCPYKICHSGSLYGFEVIDDSGIKYIFGKTAWNDTNTENYIERVKLSSRYSAMTGWMLRKIILPNGQETTFNYERYRDVDYFYPGYFTVTTAGEVIKSDGEGYGPPVQWWYKQTLGLERNGWDVSAYRYVGSDNLYIERSKSEHMTYENSRLTEVYNENEKITLTYKGSGGMHPIKSIEVTSLSPTNKVKQIQFYNEENFLNSLHISGEGFYQFSYHRQDKSYKTQVFQKAIDWWGYFNGRIDNNSTFPAYDFNEYYSTSKPGNREPDQYGIYMNARSLEEIVYPTGGSLKINYGVHKINFQSGEKVVSGLRVDSTESYDPVSGKTLIKRYEYEEPHHVVENSVGNGEEHYPSAEDFLTITYMGKIGKVLFYSTNPEASEGSMSYVSVYTEVMNTLSSYSCISDKASRIWYGKVTEHSSEGKSVYTYYYRPNDYTNRIRLGKYEGHYTAEINDLVYTSPLLLSETHFDSNNKIVKEVVNQYDISDSYIPAATCFPLKTFYLSMGSEDIRNTDFARTFNVCEGANVCRFRPNDAFPGRPAFPYATYEINTSNIALKSTQTTTYTTDNRPIVEKYEYEYDSQRPYNISRKKIYISTDNTSVEENYYYTNNTIPDKASLSTSQQNVISQMDAANYKTTVIQKAMKKGTTKLYSQLTGFIKTNNMFLPQTVYSQIGTGSFEGRIKYLKYDTKGNPLSIQKDEAEVVSYIWSYNYKYPIAEIKNASYEEIRTAMGYTTDSQMETLAKQFSPNVTQIGNTLRNYFKGKPVQITTYTYKPFVGIDSITDPRGVTTYYKYNADGQLQEVYYYEDGDSTKKRLVNSYDYHYINN